MLSNPHYAANKHNLPILHLWLTIPLHLMLLSPLRIEIRHRLQMITKAALVCHTLSVPIKAIDRDPLISLQTTAAIELDKVLHKHLVVAMPLRHHSFLVDMLNSLLDTLQTMPHRLHPQPLLHIMARLHRQLDTLTADKVTSEAQQDLVSSRLDQGHRVQRSQILEALQRLLYPPSVLVLPVLYLSNHHRTTILALLRRILRYMPMTQYQRQAHNSTAACHRLTNH